MGFAVFMNIVGVIFAITGMVLYIVDLGDASLLWICQRGVFTAGLHDDSCRNVALFAQVRHTWPLSTCVLDCSGL